MLELCNTQVVSVGISVSHSFTTIGITGTTVQALSPKTIRHRISIQKALLSVGLLLVADRTYF